MLSILIVNWNTRDLLRACLLSLRNNHPSTPYETIVVDNASGDDSADMVRMEFPEVQLIESETNTGYARGNNLAFAKAQGGLLLTLNPDTEVANGSLDRAVAFMETHPKAAYLGACQIGTNGQVQRSVRGFPSAIGILGQ